MMSKKFLSVALLVMSTIAASAADIESVITSGNSAETQLFGCKDMIKIHYCKPFVTLFIPE